jgi:hypothetical protein
MDIELPNISNYTAESDLFYIFFAILTVDVVVLFLARYFKIGGKYLNEWYDKYHILAVISDVMIIFIGFIIARYLYTIFFFDKFGWNVVYFLILLVIIQVLHDILFYVGVIQNMPKGENDMIDTFKLYAEDLGAQIIGGDALLMLMSGLVAMLYKYAPFHITSSIIALIAYMLPYAIYTRNPYNIVEVKKETVKKDDVSKEGFADPKLDAYKRMVGIQ